MTNNMVKRNKSISILRLIATIAVVFSHVCSTITENPEVATLSVSQFRYLDFLLNFCKWHVPIFFVLSGELLLNKKEITVHDCIFKYAKRMLLALLAFGIPYAILIQLFETRTVSLRMLWNSIVLTLDNKSFSHLWYLFAMIGVYAVLPLLKLIVDVASKKLLEYFVAVLFVFNFLVPFFNKMTGMSLAFTIPFGTYVIFYVLLGYCFSRIDVQKIKNVTAWSIAGLILSVGVTLAYTLILGTAEIAMSYWSPINVFVTISVYLLVTGVVSGECSKMMWKLDRLCFGVYLIHPLFIQFVYKFLKVTPMSFGAWPAMVLILGGGFVILGFLASLGMSLIKPMKKYIL